MMNDDKLRERYPLLGEAGRAMLTRLQEHRDAPRFNYATGDRLRPEDLPILDLFRERLFSDRRYQEPGPPPPSILSRVSAWSRIVPFFQKQLSGFRDLESEWERVPTTSRADLALKPWEFVPMDEPLERLIIYRTAGTTGHPITVPHHPIAVRLYEPMIEY